MALASCPAFQGQQRSLRRMRHDLSWALARSPGARSRAWARLASLQEGRGPRLTVKKADDPARSDYQMSLFAERAGSHARHHRPAARFLTVNPADQRVRPWRPLRAAPRALSRPVRD